MRADDVIMNFFDAVPYMLVIHCHTFVCVLHGCPIHHGLPNHLVLNDQLLRTAGYVTGPEFKLADISIGLSVLRWTHCEFEKPDLPAVDAYFELLKQRPAFMEHGVGRMK